MSENNLLKVLFLGDIVGKGGRKMSVEVSNKFRCSFDFLVANAENATHGYGISHTHATYLSEHFDLLTMGNHTWDHPGFNDKTAFLSSILIPYNSPSHLNGEGMRTIRKGKKVLTVISILGVTRCKIRMLNPFSLVNSIANKVKGLRKLANDDGCTFALMVDFHGEYTAEKLAFAKFLNESVHVNFFVGTHTHVPTNDGRVIDNGCFFRTDVGMTGDYSKVLGFDQSNYNRFADIPEPTVTNPSEVNITASGSELYYCPETLRNFGKSFFYGKMFDGWK